MIDILTNIVAGSLGALVFLWFHFKKYISDSKWSPKIHWQENKVRWIWIWFGLILISCSVKFIPEVLEKIASIPEINVPVEAVKLTFFSIGYAVAKIAKNNVPTVNK